MLPFVSVIIPTLNEERYIGKCLESIFNLDYPKNRYEIILVDNGSKDRTIEITKKFNAKIIKRKSLTIGTLRNIGARDARGSILAFIDADCIADRNWIKRAIINFHFHYLKKKCKYKSFLFKI